MPYQANSDLPKAIRSKYGACVSAFRGAFNSTYDKTGDEGKSFAAAHAAAQRCQQSRKESGMTLAAAKLSDISAPRFSIITKAIRSDGQMEDGRRRFRATASSTIKDRAGDEISLKALEQMATRFREGITIFTDHDNKVAHAYGTTDGAQIIQRGKDPKTGASIWDLDIEGVVNDPNPAAKQLHDSIDGGYVRFGCSVDAFVTEHERKRAEKGLLIDGLDVFAASIVGVPMNQRSWTQKALRAIKGFYGEPDDEEAPMTKELTDDTSGAVTDALEAIAEGDTDETIVLGEDGPETVTIEKAATCPDCHGGKDAEGCSNDFHKGDTDHDGDNPAKGDDSDYDSKSVEAGETADATITKGTTEGGQEADPAATPETAPESETTDGSDTAEVRKGITFEADDVVELVGNVRKMAGLVAERDDTIDALRKELVTMTAERDRLASENDEAKKVIERVMALPLRPQAVGHVVGLSRAMPDFLAPEVKDYLIKTAGETK